MARVKIDGVLDDLSSEVRSAIRSALTEVAPEALPKEQQIYRAFVRKLSSRAGTWARVRDNHVEVD